MGGGLRGVGRHAHTNFLPNSLKCPLNMQTNLGAGKARRPLSSDPGSAPCFVFVADKAQSLAPLYLTGTMMHGPVLSWILHTMFSTWLLVMIVGRILETRSVCLQYSQQLGSPASVLVVCGTSDKHTERLINEEHVSQSFSNKNVKWRKRTLDPWADELFVSTFNLFEDGIATAISSFKW